MEKNHMSIRGPIGELGWWKELLMQQPWFSHPTPNFPTPSLWFLHFAGEMWGKTNPRDVRKQLSGQKGLSTLVLTDPCTAWEALLLVLPAKAAQLVSNWSRAFSVVAPQLWNSLLLEAHLALSLLAFQKSMNTDLFQRTFL